MFDSSELKVELHTLKSDLGRPLNTASESIFDTAKNRTVELADQIKAGLNELSETLSEQEDHLDNGSPDDVACFRFRARRQDRIHAEEALR
jgi:hypothetical protein